MNQIINSDCVLGMKQLPSGSVNCCVTSPPYYGLRDYGIAGQIGLEETPEVYIQKLVNVFNEVKRVLRDDGTLWLNLGDSFFSNQNSNRDGLSGTLGGETRGGGEYKTQKRSTGSWPIKPKDLIGIPWRVAFALQADGWYLRQDIIWHKPNPMPESVTDRCTKSHEYIFLLSKQPKYYFDHIAIKEKGVCPAGTKGGRGSEDRESQTGVNSRPPEYKIYDGMRNKRDVWIVTTKPCKEAHFATFPPDLIRPCILAGAPAGGLVLDPFMGAGTTALVAKQEGRNYVGFELNPKYIEIAERRIKYVYQQSELFKI